MRLDRIRSLSVILQKWKSSHNRTFGRGLVSRVRESALGVSYFQTDAAIAGGQSGGALVSNKGEVMGIVSFWFSEAGYGLAASSVDVLPRVEEIIAGEDPSGLGDRRLSFVGGQKRHESTLSNIWSQRAYLIPAPEIGDVVEIDVTSDNNIDFIVYDSFAIEIISIDNGGHRH